MKTTVRIVSIIKTLCKADYEERVRHKTTLRSQHTTPLLKPRAGLFLSTLSSHVSDARGRATRHFRLLLQLPVHGQSDLRRGVNESLTQEEAHRPGGVV